ncbi:hypothetical protein FACS189499_05960 [Clostridia bacterium]|nr:hypothetical protein FACS189499_05960 [Clostridia bacterium]
MIKLRKLMLRLRGSTKKGFTLVECVVAIALFAVMAMMLAMIMTNVMHTKIQNEAMMRDTNAQVQQLTAGQGMSLLVDDAGNTIQLVADVETHLETFNDIDFWVKNISTGSTLNRAGRNSDGSMPGNRDNINFASGAHIDGPGSGSTITGVGSLTYAEERATGSGSAAVDTDIGLRVSKPAFDTTNDVYTFMRDHTFVSVAATYSGGAVVTPSGDAFVYSTTPSANHIFSGARRANPTATDGPIYSQDPWGAVSAATGNVYQVSFEFNDYFVYSNDLVAFMLPGDIDGDNTRVLDVSITADEAQYESAEYTIWTPIGGTAEKGQPVPGVSYTLMTALEGGKYYKWVRINGLEGKRRYEPVVTITYATDSTVNFNTWWGAANGTGIPMDSEVSVARYTPPGSSAVVPY